MKYLSYPRLLGALVSIAACLLLNGCGGSSAPPTPGEPGSRTQLMVVTVRTPEKKRLRTTTTQPATVHSYYQARIHAKISGYLEKFYVDIGEKVTEPQQLLATIAIPEYVKRQAKLAAVIDQLKAQEQESLGEVEVAQSTFNAKEAELAQAEAEIQKNQAELEAAQLAYQRKTDLVSNRSVAQRLKDEAKARLDTAQASVQAAKAAKKTCQAHVVIAKSRIAIAKAKARVAKAKINVAVREVDELKATMSYARLTAPFSGTVVVRNVEPGDLVRNSQTTQGEPAPLFVVADMSKVRVRVAIPERDTPLVQPGAAATVRLLAFQGQPIKGKVSRISKMLHEKTRTMLVEIDLENEDERLRPGMFGDATIELEDRTNCLVLPAPYVRYDEQGNGYVLLADEDDQVRKVTVSTGLDDGQQIEITNGIDSDARVIAPTPRRLKEGQQVEVSENE